MQIVTRLAKKKRSKGFTLLELMIAVVIVGILAAYAIPSYQESVKKSRRSDAKGALYQLANGMERHFTENSTYKNAADANDDGTADSDTGTPVASIFAAQNSLSENYSFNISTATTTTYLLQAIPISTSAQAGDRCGTMTLTQTGAQNASHADCW